jgi:hypothetical protein
MPWPVACYIIGLFIALIFVFLIADEELEAAFGVLLAVAWPVTLPLGILCVMAWWVAWGIWKLLSLVKGHKIG